MNDQQRETNLRAACTRARATSAAAPLVQQAAMLRPKASMSEQPRETNLVAARIRARSTSAAALLVERVALGCAIGRRG